MSPNLPPILESRPEADRIDLLTRHLAQSQGVPLSQIRVVRAPLRISPLGAHIDHQLGCVMGMAIDRAILLAFAPTVDGTIAVESFDFPTLTQFHLSHVPPYQKGDWGNYLRGAVLALQQGHRLTHGIVGVMDSDMPIGGLSSSAAVTIAYLLALEHANQLEIAPYENIGLVTRTEHNYIGLNNGILDQTSILFSKPNHLTRIDCQAVTIEPIPTAARAGAFEIMAVYSGVDKALVGTSYNNRVAECQTAAQQLLAAAGMQNGELVRLREVDPPLFAQYGAQLEEPQRRRATHFFSEMERVREGESAWRAGDILRFGALMSASGASSINNYECGCPQLITLYHILHTTPGVYGVRFSGAGFRGNCLAFIDPSQREAIANDLHRHYPVAHPEMAQRYSIHFCQPAGAAQLIELSPNS
jgi:galactokinase